MLDAFIIDRIKKEKRREQRREIQIPLYIEEPADDVNTFKKKKDKSDRDNYYERIDIETDE